MSKELEALGRIRLFYDMEIDEYAYLPNHSIPEDLDIIETALKRLENYEQNEDFNKDVLNYAFLNEQEKIKKLKALDIIKEKNVNVRAFKKVLLMKQNDDAKLRAYNSQNHRYEDDLIREEYDLLKEVML